MLGVVSVWFIAPALIVSVVAAQPDTADRDWVFGVGLSYPVATLCAGIGALRGKALFTPAAAAASVFGLSPILLYPVHGVFGVLVTTELTAPALGLALAAALTTSRSARGVAGTADEADEAVAPQRVPDDSGPAVPTDL